MTDTIFKTSDNKTFKTMIEAGHHAIVISKAVTFGERSKAVASVVIIWGSEMNVEGESND